MIIWVFENEELQIIGEMGVPLGWRAPCWSPLKGDWEQFVILNEELSRYHQFAQLTTSWIMLNHSTGHIMVVQLYIYNIS